MLNVYFNASAAFFNFHFLAIDVKIEMEQFHISRNSVYTEQMCKLVVLKVNHRNVLQSKYCGIFDILQKHMSQTVF